MDIQLSYFTIARTIIVIYINPSIQAYEEVVNSDIYVDKTKMTLLQTIAIIVALIIAVFVAFVSVKKQR